MEKHKSLADLKIGETAEGETFEDIFKKTKSKKKSNDKNTPEAIIIPLPTDDPGFFKFSKYFAFPRYDGLFQWQKEHHELTWGSKYEETLVPRDHGKSVEYSHKYQWAMWYQDFDVLLLGWTDRRKQIALEVYSFFKSQDLIEVDKRSSPFHFRLSNGSKFDCYLITSKETLGMHSVGKQSRFANMSDDEWKDFENLYQEDENKEFDVEEIKKYVAQQVASEKKLWISIDDPIDESFMKERHKEDTLELHFNSSLYPIHPYKWSFTGTHKFIGDFFMFVENKFGNDLVIYKRGTRNPDGSLLCPERFTHPDLDSYEDDLKTIIKKEKTIRDPKMDLDQIKRHVGPYTWFSEYEQDPHPITGDIWDHIKTIDLLDNPVERNYDICWITVDRATTTKTTSNYTGCIIGMRHNNGHKVITHDWTQHITLEELLLRINNFVIDFKKKFGRVRIIIIVEKQGGGDDFIEMCRSRAYFMSQGKLIKNHIAVYAQIEGIHNVGEKKQRIHDRLFLPIKNELLCIMSTLSNSEIYLEILRFPYSNYLDGIDGLANMEYELQKIPLSSEIDPFLELAEVYQRRKLHDTDPSTQTPQEKEEEVRRNIRGGKSRKVSDDF